MVGEHVPSQMGLEVEAFSRWSSSNPSPTSMIVHVRSVVSLGSLEGAMAFEALLALVWGSGDRCRPKRCRPKKGVPFGQAHDAHASRGWCNRQEFVHTMIRRSLRLVRGPFWMVSQGKPKDHHSFAGLLWTFWRPSRDPVQYRGLMGALGRFPRNRMRTFMLA